MVFADRNGQQLTFTATLQRVNHAECKDVVDVVANVRIENQGNWAGPCFVAADRNRQAEHDCADARAKDTSLDVSTRFVVIHLITLSTFNWDISTI